MHHDSTTSGRRLAALVYGGLSYAIFLGVFTYLVLFTAGVLVPKGVDDGPTLPLAQALAIDLGLIALFGVQHSVMARQAFKRFWTRIIPQPIERSTYVLVASAVVALLLAFWVPLPGTIWRVTDGVLAPVLWGLFVLGWSILLTSTYLIDHFELFGLRQVWAYFRQTRAPSPDFKTPSLYRVVRHPMMLGILIGFWATPHMTTSHLVLALGMTGYVLVGTAFEERDLLRHFGERYAAYRRRVPRFIPRPGLDAGEKRPQNTVESQT